MADYFTHFSLILTLPSSEAQSYAVKLAEEAGRVLQGDEQPESLPPELVGAIENWWFETEADNRAGKPGLWLHSSSGGIDAVCAFIQHLLKKFDQEGRVSFEWSHDCSKPKTDAYGGGAAIITAHEIKTMSTSEWLKANEA